jgi:hypothetical protein
MKYSHVLFGLILALFSAVTFAQAIDINTASAEQLDKGLRGSVRLRLPRLSNTGRPMALSSRLMIDQGAGDKGQGAGKTVNG